MTLKDILVAVLFLIGGYMVLESFVTLIRNDVVNDIKENVLQNALKKNGASVRCIRTYPEKEDRVIKQDIKPGCLYNNSNVGLWNNIDHVDNTKPKACCLPSNQRLRKRIRDTRDHGDKLMDTSRNSLINEYYNKTMLDIDMSKVDPYDPEMYATVKEQVGACTNELPKPIQKLDQPLTGHSFVSKNFCPNPAPVKYPVISDTHYLPKDVKKFNYIPPAMHCNTEPSINKVISSNLISDNMLSERVSSFKSTRTDNISGDMISVDELKFAPRELSSRYNPLDNNLYKVTDREPVRSMDTFVNNENVCGIDARVSNYAEIENNDFKETTSC
jgi:hypothetical protein